MPLIQDPDGVTVWYPNGEYDYICHRIPANFMDNEEDNEEDNENRDDDITSTFRKAFSCFFPFCSS